ncbi:hypothetical protein DIPPA_32497 [Diplonema papillatum]|nr:hypothetical protein DIPPA_32497 [Diplonema papillatum]
MIYFPEWWNDFCESIGLPPVMVFLVVGLMFWGYLVQHPENKLYQYIYQKPTEPKASTTAPQKPMGRSRRQQLRK